MKKKTVLLVVFFVIASFAVAVYFYPLMPERMVSHWGMEGQADGFASKAFALFFVPALVLAINLLFAFIPELDPERKNIAEFRRSFDGFVIVFNIFMLYVYALTIFWNAGHSFNMISAMMPAFALLFYFCGVLIGKAKKNYTIGIRLPWTLADERVWDKTHRLGAILFKAAAAIILVGAFFPACAFFLLFVPLILIFAFLAAYSYLTYRKLKR